MHVVKVLRMPPSVVFNYLGIFSVGLLLYFKHDRFSWEEVGKEAQMTVTWPKGTGNALVHW